MRANVVQAGKNRHGTNRFRPVTDVTAGRGGRLYHLPMPAAGSPRQGGREMTRFARKAWNQAQTTAIACLCLCASMALPVALTAIGFHSL
jgi:hypothetical protein